MKKRAANTGLQRLQKVMAEAGVAARRVCEQMIEAGRVTVNGETVSTLPVFVTPGEDDVRVDGVRITKSERLLYLMLNKPERTLVTSADEPGLERRTVMDLVDHPGKARLFPVGRLDFETTGLVLLTNDGDLAHRLTHPSFGIVKTYHAAVKGQVDDDLIDAVRTKLGMARARAVETGEARPAENAQPLQEIVILRREAGRTLLEITLSEARNREIREVLKMLGAPVKRLTRVGIGTLTLRGLPVGAWRELSREEVAMLRRSGRGEKPDHVHRPGASVPRKPARPRRPKAVDPVGEAPSDEAPQPRSPRVPSRGGRNSPADRGDPSVGGRSPREAKPGTRDGKRPDRPMAPFGGRRASGPAREKGPSRPPTKGTRRDGGRRSGDSRRTDRG